MTSAVTQYLLDFAFISTADLLEAFDKEDINQLPKFHIKESIVRLRGEIKTVRRLYSTEVDNKSSVGWIFAEDIADCMICSTPFGIFRSKHHCGACGNIICYSCSEPNANIEEFANPFYACFECFMGQEVVLKNPTFHEGLPIRVQNLNTFGRVEITKAESKVVLCTRKESDHSRVCINVCTSMLVPVNSDGLAPYSSSCLAPIFMVGGDASLSSDNVTVYNVTVNPSSFPDTTRTRSISNTRILDQDPTSLPELFRQIIRFIARVSMTELSADIDIISTLSYYSTDLSWGQNQELVNSNILKHENIDFEDDNKIEIAVPSKTCFERFFQIYFSLKHGKYYYKNQKLVEKKSDASSPKIHSNISTVSKLIHVKHVHEKNENDAEKAARSSIASENSRSTSISSQLSLTRDMPFPRKNSSASVVSNISDLSFINAEGNMTGVFDKLLGGTAGKKMLTPEMMEIDKGNVANSITVAKVKKDSAKKPQSLLGWLIWLYDENYQVQGKGVVTGLRKSVARHTEFRISSTEEKDIWVLLRRNEHKKGFQFQPMRRVLNF